MLLLGEFQVKLDSKGRFLLPAKLRAKLPKSAEGLVCLLEENNTGNYIALFSEEEYEKKFAIIDELNEFDEEDNSLKRGHYARTKFIDFDGAGRLALSSNLIEHAKIKKDIVLLGAKNEIEIWASDLYNTNREGVTKEGEKLKRRLSDLKKIKKSQ